jgi:hypothetical protein
MNEQSLDTLQEVFPSEIAEILAPYIPALIASRIKARTRSEMTFPKDLEQDIKSAVSWAWTGMKRREPEDEQYKSLGAQRRVERFCDKRFEIEDRSKAQMERQQERRDNGEGLLRKSEIQDLLEEATRFVVKPDLDIERFPDPKKEKWEFVRFVPKEEKQIIIDDFATNIYSGNKPAIQRSTRPSRPQRRGPDHPALVVKMEKRRIKREEREEKQRIKQEALEQMAWSHTPDLD